MAAFHKKYFHPNNMILGVVGDFKKNDMIALLKKTFRGWKKAKLELPPVPKVRPLSSMQVYVVKKAINQSNVAMGHYGIPRHNPDFYAVQIMNEILSFQRLFFQIRTEKGWAYQVGSRFSFGPNHGIFQTIMKTKVNSTHEAMVLMKKILKEIREKPVSDKELRIAKDSYLNSFVFQFSSSAKIVNRQVSLEFYGYPKDYMEKLSEKIQAVTKKDVLQAAKKYLNPENLLMVVVGDPEKFDAPLDSFGKVTEVNPEE